MTLINHEWVIDGLRELSSEAEQRRLWLSSGGEISSFVECYCRLFEDTCLIEGIENGETEFGMEVDHMLTDLEERFGAMVVKWQSEEEAITDSRMCKVRTLASITLGKIMETGSRNIGRINKRLLEWGEEEVQCQLWLPAMGGVPPKSKPYDAAWHLLRGKDYWGYLDFGDRNDEISIMFEQLDRLVFFGDLRLEHRSPQEIISDPAIRPVRKLAARITEKLEQAQRGG